jgi:hypothetical protein
MVLLDTTGAILGDMERGGDTGQLIAGLREILEQSAEHH